MIVGMRLNGEAPRRTEAKGVRRLSRAELEEEPEARTTTSHQAKAFEYFQATRKSFVQLPKIIILAIRPSHSEQPEGLWKEAMKIRIFKGSFRLICIFCNREPRGWCRLRIGRISESLSLSLGSFQSLVEISGLTKKHLTFCL